MAGKPIEEKTSKVLTQGGSLANIRYLGVDSVTFTDGKAHIPFSTISSALGSSNIGFALAIPTEGSYLVFTRTNINFASQYIAITAVVTNTSPATQYNGTTNVTLLVVYT